MVIGRICLVIWQVLLLLFIIIDSSNKTGSWITWTLKEFISSSSVNISCSSSAHCHLTEEREAAALQASPCGPCCQRPSSQHHLSPQCLSCIPVAESPQKGRSCRAEPRACEMLLLRHGAWAECQLSWVLLWKRVVCGTRVEAERGQKTRPWKGGSPECHLNKVYGLLPVGRVSCWWLVQGLWIKLLRIR